MTVEIHTSDSRGTANHGWLNSRHTFSFSNYYNPDRMNFGMLRVINDDVVAPSMGFGMHHHENMEIISIPLQGSLKHEDSMGNKHVIEAGEVQIMSAGTGISHSEYNNSDSEAVNFLQIWILPKKRNIPPRYSQKRFDPNDRKNQFQLLVSPEEISPEENLQAISINQDAYFSMANIDSNNSIDYKVHKKTNGVYIFIISGQVKIVSHELSARDGMGITDVSSITLNARENSQVLCIEVPLQ
ncbi:MAG: pirin family protein [Methylobacter sp.]|nr:pirin family protein [Methylobacter sp.]